MILIVTGFKRETTYHKINLLQRSQQTLHLLRVLRKPQIIMNRSMERNTLNLPNQLRITQ